ncbi:DDE_3 domain-containing protein [Trichonephila clavipes]|nr:DDE_3 domain-containing protein [Trichonephila clavipes]
MLGSRTDLHIFDAGSFNGTRYCNEILLPYVRLFRGAMGLQFLFMDDNAPCHRTVAAEQLLESEDIERMDWPARSPDLNPIEHIILPHFGIIFDSSLNTEINRSVLKYRKGGHFSRKDRTYKRRTVFPKGRLVTLSLVLFQTCAKDIQSRGPFIFEVW